MELGMIGLGRMGANMVRRLLRAGHRCVVYDVKPEARSGLATEGAVEADSLSSLVKQLTPPRPVWLMLPAALVDDQITHLAPLLSSGDLIIDGGNTHYPEDIRRAAELRSRGMHYLDVGTSGGIRGLERGYCLMIGGENQTVELLDPIFAALAPGLDAAIRSPERHGAPHRAELGYLHCGPAGAGHFVKMVHNGIEYGLMASYAEGFNVLRRANLGMQERNADAETTPLTQPELYRYEFNLAEIAEVWRRGSVIASWLLDLTAQALYRDPELAGFSGRVSDSGEGRWTLTAAVDEGVPAHVLSAALFQRFSSRGGAEFADQLLSAMRFQFGGHVEKGPGHQP
jgi:6-phosphogluconate dehydrogenase